MSDLTNLTVQMTLLTLWMTRSIEFIRVLPFWFIKTLVAHGDFFFYFKIFLKNPSTQTVLWFPSQITQKFSKNLVSNWVCSMLSYPPKWYCIPRFGIIFCIPVLISSLIWSQKKSLFLSLSLCGSVYPLLWLAITLPAPMLWLHVSSLFWQVTILIET